MGVIGKYETQEQIGAGTMGLVYRARDMVLERYVALKVLRTGLDANPELKERFYREAKAGARLQHPNIAIIYDLDEANGLPFIAMEFLNGSDLRALIDRAKKQPSQQMPLARKIELIAQVCDGLAHAHRHGFIHRDIKPQNIFIHDDCQAKILDFGIARLPSSTLTVAGAKLGTPNYMAPEQLVDRRYDMRSDIFSAAIVFFEFLVNEHPFKHGYPPQRIIDDEPDSLWDYDAHIPPRLEELLKRGLKKDPDERIASAREFAAELRSVLDLLRSGIAPNSASESVSFNRVESGTPIPPPGSLSRPDDDSRGSDVYEFVGLVKDFDLALSASDFNKAQATVESMRRLALVNPIFLDPLKLHDDKLAALKDSMPSVVQAAAVAASQAPIGNQGIEQRSYDRAGVYLPTGKPASATSIFSDGTADFNTRQNVFDSFDPARICPRCEAHNSIDAPQCANCGQSLERPPIIEPGGTRDRLGDNRPERGNTNKEIRRHISRTAPSVWAVFSKTWIGMRRRSSLRIRVAAIILVVLVILTLLAIVMSSPKPIVAEPAIGQAVVETRTADLMDTASERGKRIGRLDHGTRVNVLKVPADESATWVNVQYIAADPKRNTRPGYVRARDLRGWTSKDPEAAWRFLLLTRPPQSANREKLLQFVQRLEDFSIGFPRLSTRADLERARLYVELAEQSKERGAPDKERQDWIDHANAILASFSISRDPKSASEIDALKSQLSPLVQPSQSGSRPGTLPDSTVGTGLGATPATTQPPRQLPTEDKDSVLVQMPALWNTGKYDRALSLLDQILTSDPGNAKAKYWQQRMLRAKKIEDSQ